MNPWPVTVLALFLLAWPPDALPQSNAIPEISAMDATNYLGQEVVVKDTVVQVALRPTVALLNLNQRYPDSPLTCVIRGKNTNNFPDIETYVGRRVEVTGRIIAYQGRPEIILKSTNDIKILESPPVSVQPPASTAEPPDRAPPSVAPTTMAPSLAESLPPTVVASGRAVWWMVGLLGLIVLLLGCLVLLFWRRVPVEGGIPNATRALIRLHGEANDDPASVENWKQRALDAEVRAGQQAQMLREKLMPELAEFAKQSLVQGLYAQRKALIETQQKAHQALAELEARLADLHLPAQKRIQAYEQRIAELEMEIETQGEELRELARATLSLVRRKLEDEREFERSQNPFN